MRRQEDNDDKRVTQDRNKRKTSPTKTNLWTPTTPSRDFYKAAAKAKNRPEPRAGEIDATHFRANGDRSFTADVPQTTRNRTIQNPTGPRGRFSRFRAGSKSKPFLIESLIEI